LGNIGRKARLEAAIAGFGHRDRLNGPEIGNRRGVRNVPGKMENADKQVVVEM
jgi:hypothetical protein